MSIQSIEVNAEPSIHHTLHGEEIDYVATNGMILVIRTKTGREVQIAWVDGNGEPIRGMPALRFAGLHIHAKTSSMELHINK